MKRKINDMKNLLLGLAALIGMSGLLSGCSLSANSVKLHTQKEMQEIVNEKYGEAEFIGMEENKEAHKRIFTFRDKKYGFTYQTMSHPHGVGMDGSTFYYDGATIWYGYEEPFLEYFKETEGPVFAKQGIELCDDLKFAKASGSVRKFDLEEKILYSTSSKWESDLAFTWERYQEYASVPELHRLREIKVYDTDQGIFLGNMSEEGFVTAEKLRIDYFMQQAKYLTHHDEIEYLRHEEMRVSEVPGLSEQHLYDYYLEKQDGKVTLYYFSCEGQEYFIVDTWVAQINPENGGSIYQYYQNCVPYEVSGE